MQNFQQTQNYKIKTINIQTLYSNGPLEQSLLKVDSDLKSCPPLVQFSPSSDFQFWRYFFRTQTGEKRENFLKKKTHQTQGTSKTDVSGEDSTFWN